MKSIEQSISRLFTATDNKDWATVEKQFADSVKLDYSSMTGNPANQVTPQEITKAWKTILPVFDFTHHQVGNFLINQSSTTMAKASCYGIAMHYLDNPKGNVWTVVGSYDFKLESHESDWKITEMIFHFKFQEGNMELPQMAMNKTKGQKGNQEDILTQKDKVRLFFNHLENGELDKLVDMFAEDGVHVNPYHSDIFPTGAEGKEAIRNYWAPVFSNFPSMAFPIELIYATEDPNIVFVQYKGIIQMPNDAGEYRNQYYSLFTFNDKGLITEYIEIFNPITAAKGFGLLDKLK